MIQTRRSLLITIILCLAMFCTGLIVAQPARNISARRHPNLAAAQRFIDQAFGKITAAQEANEWDMEGHAKKAKELLDQASAELKRAAEEANEHHK